jgi:hypothetical protein
MTKKADEYLDELRERGPVYEGDHVLADIQMAAYNGLGCVLAKKKGGKEKLSYIIRRIEQYAEKS